MSGFAYIVNVTVEKKSFIKCDSKISWLFIWKCEVNSFRYQRISVDSGKVDAYTRHR